MSVEMTSGCREVSSHLGAPLPLLSKDDFFRRRIEEFWHSHFNQRFSWNKDMNVSDDTMSQCEGAKHNVVSSHGLLRDESTVYECVGMEVVHHNRNLFGVAQQCYNEKVEAKYEPLCYRDGSFDSLAYEVRCDSEFGSDQGNLDLIKPAELKDGNETVLRGGEEANVDLFARQVWGATAGSSGDGNLSCQGCSLPSWCRRCPVPHGDVADSQKRGKGKKVTFSTTVELHLVFQEQHCIAVMNDVDAHDMWRHFWHLHGQIAVWKDFQIGFARLAALNLIPFWNGEPVESYPEELAIFIQNPYTEQGVAADGWWNVISQQMFTA